MSIEDSFFAMSRVCTFLILIVFTTGLYAQTGEVQKWTKFLSSSKDFSVTLPSDLITYPTDNYWTLTSHNSEVAFVVTFSNSSKAKTDLDGIRAKNEYPDLVFSRFRTGDFVVDIGKIEKTPFYISIDAASSKGLYRIWITGKNADSPKFLRILNSIALQGNPLIKGAKSDEWIVDSELSIESIKTSPVINDELLRKRMKNSDTKIGNIELKQTELNVIYSRPFLMLKKDRPSYTDDARARGVQGTIKMLVTFKGNGDIGPISIISGLPSGLNNEAVVAARKIRFLPAEVEGKPFDTVKIVTYSFAIY